MRGLPVLLGAGVAAAVLAAMGGEKARAAGATPGPAGKDACQRAVRQAVQAALEAADMGALREAIDLARSQGCEAEARAATEAAMELDGMQRRAHKARLLCDVTALDRLERDARAWGWPAYADRVHVYRMDLVARYDKYNRARADSSLTVPQLLAIAGQLDRDGYCRGLGDALRRHAMAQPVSPPEAPPGETGATA